MNTLEKAKLAAWIRSIKQIFKINNTNLSRSWESYKNEGDGETVVKKGYDFETNKILSLKIKKSSRQCNQYF